MKKAQGISVNVIIIAAIALLVLVVLSVIYIGRMGDWGAKTADCETNGGKCSISACGAANTNVADYPTSYSIWDCDNLAGGQAQNCCIEAGP